VRLFCVTGPRIDDYFSQPDEFVGAPIAFRPREPEERLVALVLTVASFLEQNCERLAPVDEAPGARPLRTSPEVVPSSVEFELRGGSSSPRREVSRFGGPRSRTGGTHAIVARLIRS